MVCTRLPLRDDEIAKVCDDNFLEVRVNNNKLFKVYYRFIKDKKIINLNFDIREQKYLELHVVDDNLKCLSTYIVYVTNELSLDSIYMDIVNLVYKTIYNFNNLFLPYVKTSQLTQENVLDIYNPYRENVFSIKFGIDKHKWNFDFLTERQEQYVTVTKLKNYIIETGVIANEW